MVDFYGCSLSQLGHIYTVFNFMTNVINLPSKYDDTFEKIYKIKVKPNETQRVFYFPLCYLILCVPLAHYLTQLYICI